MDLYTVNRKIKECIDSETGEVNEEVFNELQCLYSTRDGLIEDFLVQIKNMRAIANQIKVEEDILKARRKALEDKVNNASEFIQQYLDGEKFITSKVEVSYRKSSRVELDAEEFVAWARDNNRDDLLNYKDPEPAKTAIKDYIKAHPEEKIPASIAQHVTMTIH